MKDSLFEAFRDPPKQFRPSPFWSWNDALREDELRWQVREMKGKGFGGYFMHSRVGLVTEYLSDEWMRMIGACLDEGKKVNTESWLYDEDKWPSGFAGGLVPEESEAFRSKGITARELDPTQLESAESDPKLLAIFSVKKEPDGSISEVAKIHPGGGGPIEGGDLLAFSVAEAQASNWYNGETYVDLLNPEATEAFLEVTHDAYAKRFGGQFGEFMPGIFTDEPNYSPSGNPPWTDGFRDYFKERNGYDIVDKLPHLYFQSRDGVKARHDYWRTATRRFVEAFSMPLGARCEKLGLKLTGHYLSEDTLAGQVRVIGAAMPHYEHMHVPGIDHLCRNISNPLTLKQVSSASRQFGRKRVMCEIFGCSGHTMTFEDQKWISDFHFVLGITFLVPHLTLYSMPGDRKRDYPPTLSYHQPYWGEYRLINDYLSRCSMMVSQGEPVVDVLVLHSIASAWATYLTNMEGEDWSKKITEASYYSAELCKVLDHLISGHRDFDFGDEFIMEKHAKVESGSIKIGDMRYRVVVVPPSLTWSSSTLRLIQEFVSSGGKLIFVGEVPSMVDAEPSEGFPRVLANPNSNWVLNERDALLSAIDSCVDRDVSIRDADGNELADLYCQHRRDGARHILFISSKNRDMTIPAKVSIRAKGQVTEWDAATGEVVEAKSSVSGEWTHIETEFPPVGSHIFVIGGATVKAKRVLPKKGKVLKVLPLHDAWTAQRLHPNSLTLDRCSYSMGGSPWQGPSPVWKVRREVVKAAGMEKYAGTQPWALIRKKLQPEPVEVRMKFKFTIEEMPKRLGFVAEKIHNFAATVNGQRLDTRTSEWHWDKQFGEIDVTPKVVVGTNEIELSCKYNSDVQIEDAFLVGDFGVRRRDPMDYVITSEPSQLKDGNWVDQGYAFYCGNMRYLKHLDIPAKKGSNYTLRLIDPRGTLFKVSLNGRFVGAIWKQPWELDLTKFVRKKDNVLEVEVCSSLRNTFGPLHHRLGDKLPWTGPGEFVDEKNWTDQYQFAPYGLLGGAEIEIKGR